MLFISFPIDEEQTEKDKGMIQVPFEHSLVSISKWEAKWHEPFFADSDKTDEQLLDYILCMIVRDEDRQYVSALQPEHVDLINKYLSDPATATKIYNLQTNAPHRRSIMTSEVLYYQMIIRNIPMECQYWNINRLITLIRVWDTYNGDGKKQRMNQKQTAAYYAQENARRRKLSHSKG